MRHTGTDQTSGRRSHGYKTALHDLAPERPLWLAKGHNLKTLQALPKTARPTLCRTSR